MRGLAVAVNGFRKSHGCDVCFTVLYVAMLSGQWSVVEADLSAVALT